MKYLATKAVMSTRKKLYRAFESLQHMAISPIDIKQDIFPNIAKKRGLKKKAKKNCNFKFKDI